MSLYIDVDKVSAVLLADGWHEVAKDSFDLDAYEYHRHDVVLLGGGDVEGIPSIGATWAEANGVRIACPLTAVLAVRICGSKKRSG